MVDTDLTKEKEYSQDLPPKFNAGLAKMLRIHKLWEMSHNAKMNLDENGLMAWLACLIGLKGEFIDRVKDESNLKKAEDIIEKARTEIELMKALANYELTLHRVEKDVGYSVPDKKTIFESEM